MGKIQICLLSFLVLLICDTFSQSNDNTIEESFFEQFGDRTITIIDGVLLSDSMEIEIDEISSISTLSVETINILAKDKKKEYQILQKYSEGKTGVIVVNTKKNELEKYLHNSVEVTANKIPIAVNGELIIGPQNIANQYSNIEPDTIKSIKFLNPKRASRKYKLPLVFGVIEVRIK